jgi:hypothetical protein
LNNNISGNYEGTTEYLEDLDRQVSQKQRLRQVGGMFFFGHENFNLCEHYSSLLNERWRRVKSISRNLMVTGAGNLIILTSVHQTSIKNNFFFVLFLLAPLKFELKIRPGCGAPQGHNQKSNLDNLLYHPMYPAFQQI